MTFQDPGARQDVGQRAPVNIEVRFPGGNAPLNWDDVPDYKPPAKADQPTPADNAPINWDAIPDYQPPPRQAEAAKPETGGAPEAFGKATLEGASFGFTPALAGLREAAGPEVNAFADQHLPLPIALGVKHAAGAARLLIDAIGAHEDPEVRSAFTRGRDAAVADQDTLNEAHPWAYGAGRLFGSVLTPIPGIGTAGGLGARALRGAVGGAIGGGLTGAGESISRGESLPEIGAQTATGVGVGGALGGAFGSVLGPRLIRPATTPGGQAAETAARLGAPLSRGLTSDSPTVQMTTAGYRSVPVIGSMINARTARTAEAAGEHLESISQDLAGGATSRAAADVVMRPALQDVINNNKTSANAIYGNVRGMINPDRPYQLPQTQAMLDQVVAERQAAGWNNPEQGLEQFRNVAERGSFNGAHRARVDARSAGNVANPNPGYNAADYNRLTGAMTEDLRNLVHTEGGQKALDAFDATEKEFGSLAEQNELLGHVLNSRGQGAVETLLRAAGERHGDAQLLAGLKRTMQPADFEHIGGALLSELGRTAPTDPFSFAKFVTGYKKLSDPAKAVLFSPQHRADIEQIFGMGKHLGKALEESNVSHTSGPLLMFEALKQAAEIATAIAAGHMTVGTTATLGAGAVGGTLGMWLASPAKTASMRAFGKAATSLSQRPSPARQAVFQLATRNLANNLGIPVEQFARRLTQAQPESQNPAPGPPRPVNHKCTLARSRKSRRNA